jgi:hypothetical protein
MTGSKGLMAVTALTVASLLLGGGALNALAEGHGGKNGGNGSGQVKSERHQPENHGASVRLEHDAEAQGANHDERDDRQNDVKRNHHDDDEDLVTQPPKVTGEDRPGLGCGDDNHTHTGAPGNPDKTCGPHGGGEPDDES